MLSHSAIPSVRVRAANPRPVRAERDLILYWMTSFRRTHYNFALQRAVEWSNYLGKPLLVLEALRVNYPWASDRFHRFVIDGMIDNAASLARAGVTYYPYIEPAPDAGKGLVAALASHAAVVVTDHYLAFFLPAATRAAATRVDVRLEAIDSNGLHALSRPGRAFDSALAFRRWLQQNIFEDLVAMPQADPLAVACTPGGTIPGDVASRWPPMNEAQMAARNVAVLPIDHTVPPASIQGGSAAAAMRLSKFVADSIPGYAARRNHPDLQASSGLSPYLHFGHISTHEIFTETARADGWSLDRIESDRRGSRTGFWGMSGDAEAFLDQLITWRELGYNFFAYRADCDRYESLPDWAQRTLAKHEGDRRPQLYSIEQLEHAETSDILWNAAQVQLIREGVIHNYLRMLWGKRILEWTASPRDALYTMIHLNNKYALDGRDPNSYSGIFWTLGRYDRPWGPERSIFGTVRYMSSANTMRKLKLRRYLARYGPEAA
jgi:deoxyribodipyrimidine photo-lyase